MISALVLLSMTLVQEPVRVQEDAKARRQGIEADQHYRAGVDALGSERYEVAEEELRQAVKLDPNLYLAYYSLGKVYIALKQYDDSVRAYQDCQAAWDRSLNMDAQRSLDQESRREDQIRDLRDRIQELEASLRTARSDGERQQLLSRIQNIRVGIDSLERMRGRNRGTEPPPPEFALALGSAHLRAGSVAEAERAYLEALRLRPKYGEAHNNLAVICIKRGDYEAAYQHVKAAQKAGFKVHPQLVKDVEAARVPEKH